MLIELLAQSNYGSYNIKLANVLGLHCAIYINELLSVNEKAFRKGKLQKDSFVLDRDYITERTTLSTKEQLEIEKTLKKLGILKSDKGDSENTVTIDITTLTTMLMTPDESLLKDMTNIIKKATPKNKKDKEIEYLKTCVKSKYPEVVHALNDWIDNTHPQKYLNSQTIQMAQDTLDAFASNQPDVQVAILKIATANMYKDITWAISLFKKNYQPNITIKQTQTSSQAQPQMKKRLSTEVF